MRFCAFLFACCLWGGIWFSTAAAAAEMDIEREIYIPEIVVPQFAFSEIDKWQKERAVYVAVVNTSQQLADLLTEEYLAWAGEAGPAAAHLANAEFPAYQKYLAEWKKAMEQAKAIPDPLPEFAGEIAVLQDAVRDLEPILAEAFAYYENKVYLQDKGEEGRVLHERLLPPLFLAIEHYLILDNLTQQLSLGISARKLEAIESEYGRGFGWHHLSVQYHTQRLMAVLANAEGLILQEIYAVELESLAKSIDAFIAYTEKTPTEQREKEVRFAVRASDLQALKAVAETLGKQIKAGKLDENELKNSLATIMAVYQKLLQAELVFQKK